MNPILQFGTSRFLQAHADLFISEAAQRGLALGGVTVVQTSDSADSARRVAAFRQPGGYPVCIRGWRAGAPIDTDVRVVSVTEAFQAREDWPAIVARVAGPVQVILSNTADQGYQLNAEDHAGLLDGGAVPRSFPAKLLVLLHARYRRGAAPITLMPCELVSHNGDVLCGVVTRLARDWQMDAGFLDYLETDCVWVNSLVDRIVSEPIAPVGAVAEPYALWAIERQPGMVLPCRHPNMIVTDALDGYERRKLFLLNLGHTYLAQLWLDSGAPAAMTVLQAMADAAWRAGLEAVWSEEVLPVFAGMGHGEDRYARAYLAEVRQRFLNPFLAHRLADIARNHDEKKRRRLAPVLTLAAELGLDIRQPRLRAALAGVA